MKKLTKEDIQKYGTEEEIKLLESDDSQYEKNRRSSASGSMTNFVEMGNYWGEISKIKRDDESWITSFHIKDGNPDGGAPKGTKFKEADITIEKFLKAVDNLIKNPKKYKVDPSYARVFVGDEWDSDVNDDDIIIQIIVFGEVIYG